MHETSSNAQATAAVQRWLETPGCQEEACAAVEDTARPRGRDRINPKARGRMPANAQCARSRMTARPERNPQAPTRPERGAVPRDPGYGPPFGPTMGFERPKTPREIRAGRHRVVFQPRQRSASSGILPAGRGKSSNRKNRRRRLICPRVQRFHFQMHGEMRMTSMRSRTRR